MDNDGTKLITLIGTPLAQSFSVRMQNRAYKEMNLNMRYFNTEAGPDELEGIISKVRSDPGFLGAAVTKPDKVEVLKYLDETDELCAKLGACNTIVKTPEGKLKGYNTDGIGFYKALTELPGLSIEGKTFFCFGAGGAGRAICSILAYYGAKKIYVTSLTAASRNRMVSDINNNFAPVAEAVDLNDYSHIQDCDVIINASGLGMKHPDETPLPKEKMNPGAFYYDACYNPDKTKFLLDAESIGAGIMNGLTMCLYQGAAQIELWQSKPAPVDIMRSELLQILKENR